MNIYIKSTKIKGIFNKRLEVTCNKYKKNYITVLCDKKELDFEVIKNRKNNILIYKLPKKFKNIEAYENNSDNKIIVSEKNLFYRIKNYAKNSIQYLPEVRYQKNSNIKIEKVLLTGVKNPLLNVLFKVKSNDYIFEIIADGTILKTSNILTNNNLLDVKCILPRKAKLIKVILKTNNKEFVVMEIASNTWNRLYRKFISSFYNFLKTVKRILLIFKKGVIFLWKKHHFLITPTEFKEYRVILIDKLRNINVNDFYDPFNQDKYLIWINETEKEVELEKFKLNPLISFAIPVYNIEREFLVDCLDSILDQTYTNFEICLADDCSTKKETISTLEEYEKKDKRIKIIYRKENGHISKATNSALELTSGEYIALMDDDDILPKNALYECVKAINENPKIDMIYTDEDKMGMDGIRCEPHFKSDFAPDSLLGGNYICHFPIMRKAILNKIGGLRHEYVGAQDFDLFLRFTEEAKVIHHIPKILYHWRKVPGSTADTIENKDYAIENGRKAVAEAIKRRGLEGDVYPPIKCTHYIVNYKPKKLYSVSVIIEFADNVKFLEKCLDSILENTDYENYEINILYNKSDEPKLSKKYDEIISKIRLIKISKNSKNYITQKNEIIKKLKSDYLVFINGNSVVDTKNWLQIMLGYASRKDIGAVGAKIINASQTIYSAGMVLGGSKIYENAFQGFSKISTGLYGRLLVPYNYSAVSSLFFMVEKSKLMEIGLFDSKFSNELSMIDICLKLKDKKYRSIILPQILINLRKKIDLNKIDEKQNEIFIKKWIKAIEFDSNYNNNLSKENLFFLNTFL